MCVGVLAVFPECKGRSELKTGKAKAELDACQVEADCELPPTGTTQQHPGQAPVSWW